MKKFIFTFLVLSMCFITNINALPANVATLSVLSGGLQTKDEDIAPAVLKPSHEIGGIGFSLGLIHFLNPRLIPLHHDLRLGIEGDYSILADNTYSYSNQVRDKYTSNAMSALAVLQYTFAENWLAVGKAGVARVAQTLKTSSRTQTKAEFAPQFLLGGGYQFNDYIQALLQYNYISGSAPALRSNNKVAAVQTFNFTLNILF